MRSDLGNRHRISADLFLKQAPKVQASGGGGGLDSDKVTCGYSSSRIGVEIADFGLVRKANTVTYKDIA